MAGLDHMGIRLSGPGGGIFLQSSSSGLVRGSLHTHSALIRGTCRAATDARVKPEHDDRGTEHDDRGTEHDDRGTEHDDRGPANDDRGNVGSYPDLNLMHMRLDRAISRRAMAMRVTRPGDPTMGQTPLTNANRN